MGGNTNLIFERISAPLPTNGKLPIIMDVLLNTEHELDETKESQETAALETVAIQVRAKWSDLAPGIKTTEDYNIIRKV